MTITIELPRDLEDELKAEAERLGLPLSEYALRILAMARRPEERPKTGAELVAYWRKEQVIGGRPLETDSPKLAREIRSRAQLRS